MTKAKLVTSTTICSILAPSCKRAKQRLCSCSVAVPDDSTGLMKSEIEAAVKFFTCFLEKAEFDMDCMSEFQRVLTALLKQYYKGHWYPNEPLKGSGYRCLRVNGVMHPLLVETARLCKLPMRKVRRAFPRELTVWVDPSDVSVRFGEEGSIGIVYSKFDSAKHLDQKFDCNRMKVGTKRVLLMLADRTIPVWLEDENSTEGEPGNDVTADSTNKLERNTKSIIAPATVSAARIRTNCAVSRRVPSISWVNYGVQSVPGYRKVECEFRGCVHLGNTNKMRSDVVVSGFVNEE